MSHLHPAEAEKLVNNLEKVEKGLNLSKEEESWAIREAFKHPDHLAFSKKELGLCSATTFEMKLKDPEQKPIG